MILRRKSVLKLPHKDTPLSIYSGFHYGKHNFRVRSEFTNEANEANLTQLQFHTFSVYKTCVAIAIGKTLRMVVLL